jgi:hypothetical protein
VVAREDEVGCGLRLDGEVRRTNTRGRIILGLVGNLLLLGNMQLVKEGSALLADWE